jgi:SPP1 family phage portal protein
MIQLSNVKELNEENIYKLVDLVTPELNKKKELYKRYRRKSSDVEIIGANDKKNIVVPFEKYIVDIATGYLGGKEPTYEVEDTADEKKKSIIKKVLDKIVGEKDYKDSMETIINYITNYNDDGLENYQLVHDLLATGSCYEILYENEDNEKVYSRVSPLQTQAIWDYSIPKQLIGMVQMYTEKNINNQNINVVTLTDTQGTRIFKGGVSGSNDYQEITQTDEDGNEIVNNHNWGDVPFTCVEVPDSVALFEPVLDLIKAYELLIKETKETFSYNANAKLKVTGYRPEYELLIEDEKNPGKYKTNPVRKQMDETLLNMQVFYTPDDGDIDWIIKPMDDGVIQNTLKTYIDLIMMNTGVPQTTDLGFTKADNASAIDRKFFSLEQTTAEAMQLLKMAYKRRWELIFNRINLKGTKYDFRDIKITLNKNLPANENEIVDMYMKLRGLISDETIIERLPLNFDSTSELNKMEEQDEQQLNKEVEKASAFNEINGDNTNNPKQEEPKVKKDKKEEGK